MSGANETETYSQSERIYDMIGVCERVMCVVNADYISGKDDLNAKICRI